MKANKIVGRENLVYQVVMCLDKLFRQDIIYLLVFLRASIREFVNVF